MTYDILIRHTRPTDNGGGLEQWMEMRHLDAGSEFDAFSSFKHGPDDFVACIDAWHHRGVAPFSVDVGDPDFFTEVHRPYDHLVEKAGGEARVG